MEAVLQNMDNHEKLEYIFSELEKGKDREELAINLGYKNYKSMDMFVRRQGYTWDRHLGKYLLPEERTSGRYAQAVTTIKGKVGEVISLFAKGEMDAKEIAKQVGFGGHRELALYMKAKGYQWDAEIANYRLAQEEVGDLEDDCEASEESTQLEDAREKKGWEVHLLQEDRYQRLLEYLLQKEEMLRQLLEKKGVVEAEGIIPRYAVPGIFVTKSVHMTNQLDQLVRDFSKEKNISQRELFEVALVEFFQKYGYKQEVDTLLQQK